MQKMKTFDHEIQLISLIEGTDDDGFPVEEERPKESILANRLSIRSNEFWQSKQSGIKLSYTFEVHSFEYSGEEKLLYEGNEHRIERSYVREDGLTELICSRRADSHES